MQDVNSINKKSQKYTIIIEGEPGTGKSVVAIQLLCDLIQMGYSVNYVTKNAAPRNVYFEKLKQDKFKLRLDLVDIMNDKMDKTEKKYPVDKAKGVSTKYDKL